MTEQGPLSGTRVLEVTAGRAGRTAGMLLADLGADVVRLVPADWCPPDPASAEGPEHLCLDRGKTLATGGPEVTTVERLARAADVVLDDTPTGLARSGAELRAQAPALVHVALPPVGPVGRWRSLPHDPLFVGALGGFATQHPAHEPGTPIASVVPLVSALQGALGAALAVAGLFGARTTGHGRTLEVTGLHASAACLGTLVVEGLDTDQTVTPDGRVAARPAFRVYRCADDRYLHLSALTVEFFLPALAVLGREDVMAMPGVDGEFLNTMRPEVGHRVGAELQRTFLARPRDEWLELLTGAGVPCAPVLPRSDWLTGEVVAAAAPPVVRDVPGAGPVLLPGVPLTLSATPGAVGRPAGAPVPAEAVWPDPRPLGSPRPEPTAPGPLLDGLRVLDLSTFFAAPFAAALLADLGACVVKIEPPRRDPYRAFAPAYAAVNHHKTVATMDLREAAGHDAVLDLAARADVVVDNLRPAVAARLGLDDRAFAGNQRLVRASVSAFGRSGPYAELPGFDPVLQSRSGLADAQGGDDQPVPTSAGVVDVSTGALTALGILAALVARVRTGQGQHVTTSLAATSTFLQGPELTDYAGRPAAERGGRDHRGPEPLRRYHRASDGWLAVAATTESQRREAAALLGLDTVTHDAVAEALAGRPVEHWLTALGALGVPCCAVTPREGLLHDPYLVSNDYSHVVGDPDQGRFRLVRGYFREIGATLPGRGRRTWPGLVPLLHRAGADLRPGYTVVAPDEPADAPAVGHDTQAGAQRS